MADPRVAFIGGSGLYEMDGLSDVRHVDVDTPFGSSSDSIAIGDLDGITAAFLPRHGKGHRLSPTEIPARANIYALKTLGVERIVSVSAVGSLREHIRPLDMLIPDQKPHQHILWERHRRPHRILRSVLSGDQLCARRCSGKTGHDPRGRNLRRH